MSVDAKLFVCAGKEVALDLLSNVLTVIKNESLGFYGGRSNEYEPHFMGSLASFYIGFKYRPVGLDTSFQNRQLSIHFGCDCDYSDTYKGDKVILSLGCWGSSDEIMKTLAKALAQFGDVYYDHNDCDAEGFVKLYNKGE